MGQRNPAEGRICSFLTCVPLKMQNLYRTMIALSSGCLSYHVQMELLIDTSFAFIAGTGDAAVQFPS